MAPRYPRAVTVVLTSTERFRPETNPYLVQLRDAIGDRVVQLPFSWRTALSGRYDVFHLHWPEVKLRGTTTLRSVARSVLFLCVLLRLRLGRRALVRTFHNVAPHERLPWPQRGLVRLCDRWTTLWVVLSERGPRPPGDAPTVLAPIGHYREWFAGRPRRAAVPGRLAFVGLVRRYKGVERLVEAFTGLDDADLSLHVVGRVEDADLGERLRRLAADDPRVSIDDAYVPDDRLVEEVTSAELVVLPFVAVTNSSSVLVALSLDRPVLAPRIPVIEELADEVGAAWVLTYDGTLEPATIAEAITRVRARAPGPAPALARRDWGQIGAVHAAAYTRAAAIASGRTTRAGAGGRGRIAHRSKDG